MIQCFVDIVVLLLCTASISGDHQALTPLEFVEQFEDTFSEYIFGYKNCYYYKISPEVTNHCSPIHGTIYTDSADTASTESAHHSILETNTWKRLLLNNAKNTHCYIGTLYLCSSRSTYQAKQFALENIKIPSQTCFESNIISGKAKHKGKGIGIQLFKSTQCESEQTSSPFIFCTDGSHTTTEAVDFCFNINDESRCFHKIPIPDICDEVLYDKAVGVESSTTFEPNTTNVDKQIKTTKQNRIDDINRDALNPSTSTTLITSGKSRWLIAILSVMGVCILSMVMVICGWRRYMCHSFVNNDDDDIDTVDETVEYDDGREFVQHAEFESEDRSVWHHMLDID